MWISSIMSVSMKNNTEVHIIKERKRETERYFSLIIIR